MLDQLMPWLNSNSPAVQALATVVLVVITWSYAQVTRQALRQAQRQHLDAARPAIVFRLLSAGSYDYPVVREFTLVVTNAGFGPALNVRINLSDSHLDYKHRVVASVPTPEPLALTAGQSLELWYAAAKNPDDLGGALKNPDAVGEGEVAGVVRARFYDIYGREFGAEAPLEGGAFLTPMYRVVRVGEVTATGPSEMPWWRRRWRALRGRDPP